MKQTPADISIERLLEQDIPELIGFHKDIVMIRNLEEIHLFSHPARLAATTVLVCLEGEIDCSINLKNYRVTANHILVNFAGDIIRINCTRRFSGYAILLSENYLQQLQLDFRLRTESYIALRGNGPISVPDDELLALRPYDILLKMNIEENRPEVLKGLVLALSCTIIDLIKKYQDTPAPEADAMLPRARMIFDKFIRLLGVYHTSQRTLQFYADKMCLTPKYVSAMIKQYSGRGALDWINEYVVLEAKMMLRYTDLSVQEISNRLNFPTQSAFGKYFKQQSGVCPKHYRLIP